jgi:hypothetical protein
MWGVEKERKDRGEMATKERTSGGTTSCMESPHFRAKSGSDRPDPLSWNTVQHSPLHPTKSDTELRKESNPPPSYRQSAANMMLRREISNCQPRDT